MRMLTEAEHEELLQAKAQLEAQRRAVDEVPIDLLVRGMLAEVDKRGLVLTVEQQPLQPLAMGHHRTVYSLRAKRSPA